MARPSDPHARIDLLRAAEAVFVESGLDRAKGSSYLHFESKEDAFRQIVESMVARLADLLDRHVEREAAGADLSVICDEWATADGEIFEFLWQNRGVARLLFEGGGSASFKYLMDEFAERARAHITSSIQRMVRAGIYRADLDVEMASLALAGAYDRVGRELVHREQKPDLCRWLSGVQQVFLRGLASPRLAAALGADQPVTHAAPAGPATHADGKRPTRKRARRSALRVGTRMPR